MVGHQRQVLESLQLDLFQQQKKENELRAVRRQGLDTIRYLRMEQTTLSQQLESLDERQRLLARLHALQSALNE